MLKPYGGERNVSYIVLAPDNEFIAKVCKKFFSELSQVYETCHMGKHSPLPTLPDGILRIGKRLSSEVNDKSTSDWFNRIGMCHSIAELSPLLSACGILSPIDLDYFINEF